MTLWPTRLKAARTACCCLVWLWRLTLYELLDPAEQPHTLTHPPLCLTVNTLWRRFDSIQKRCDEPKISSSLQSNVSWSRQVSVFFWRLRDGFLSAACSISFTPFLYSSDWDCFIKIPMMLFLKLLSVEPSFRELWTLRKWSGLVITGFAWRQLPSLTPSLYSPFLL